MRVEARREAATAAQARPSGFEAALRRAEVRRAAAEARRATGAAHRARGPGSRPGPAEVSEEGRVTGRAAARGARGRGGGEAAGGEDPAEGAGEARRASSDGVAWAGERGMASPSSAVPAPLARAVAQVAPAIEAFWREGRAALSLDFGRALGLELRSEGGAVALALSAPPDLVAAARSAVPGLVAALAVRGIPLVRAEVRQRGQPPARRGR